MLSVLKATVGRQVKSICRGCRNADDRRPKLEKLLFVLSAGRLCIGTLTLRVRALPVLCPTGAIRRAASREMNAFHCRYRKNYYPCPSEKQGNESGNVEREKSDERAIGRSCVAAEAHVRYAIFNACHHGHDAQSHALRTRGPCIPIGNFPGLMFFILAIFKKKKKRHTRSDFSRSSKVGLIKTLSFRFLEPTFCNYGHYRCACTCCSSF